VRRHLLAAAWGACTSALVILTCALVLSAEREPISARARSASSFQTTGLSTLESGAFDPGLHPLALATCAATAITLALVAVPKAFRPHSLRSQGRKSSG
jgi:hypothetical protein